MELTIDYEFQPEGSVLVHKGAAKQDEGGAWFPVVYKIGQAQYQCGVVSVKNGSKTVVHKAILDDLGFARQVADELARLAAA